MLNELGRSLEDLWRHLFGELRFAYPLFFLLIAIIPLGVAIARRTRKGTVRFSSILPFKRMAASWRVGLRFAVPGVRILVLLALIFALARPQAGNLLARQKSRGIGILLLIDSSASMLQEDFEIDRKKVTRLEAVKAVVKDFVQGTGGLRGRPDDEIGIVSFTGYPVPRAPLTLDHGAVLEVLASIEAPDPQKAERDRRGQPLYPEEFNTAIGDALARGADRLSKVGVKSKVMILLSDGAQTMGTLAEQEGAKIAASFGIKVYTIGIGQAGVILVDVMDPIFGKRKMRRRSDLDEATLQAIAEITGGKYFNAASTDALRDVYEEIDELERSEIETSRFYRWDERFQIFALLGLGLLFLEVLLSQTVFRRIP